MLGRVEEMLSEMQLRMLERARNDLKDRITDLEDIPYGYDLVDVARVGWCGEEDCATQIEVNLEVTFLGEDMDLMKPPIERCTTCGAASKMTVYVSRTY